MCVCIDTDVGLMVAVVIGVVLGVLVGAFMLVTVFVFRQRSLSRSVIFLTTFLYRFVQIGRCPFIITRAGND